MCTAPLFHHVMKWHGIAARLVNRRGSRHGARPGETSGKTIVNRVRSIERALADIGY